MSLRYEQESNPLIRVGSSRRQRRPFRKLRSIAFCVSRWGALVLALGISSGIAGVHQPVDAGSANSSGPRQESTEPSTSPLPRSAHSKTGIKDVTYLQLAQFELPKRTKDGSPVFELPKRLTYQYGYGSESDFTYRFNPDLNDDVKDHSLIATPEINGTFTYRPNDWLETTVELIFEREIALEEQDRLVLPDGDVVFAEHRRFSLLIDQAFVTIKDIIDPFSLSVGRKNYEDERHWLYDTSMDIVSLQLKLGTFRAEALAGREVWQDLDLLHKESKDRIDTYLLYSDYRGIEDVKLAAYAILRDDRANTEGSPLTFGLRSQGMRSDQFNYWAELAFMRGEDEDNKDFDGYAFDVGGTYRFLGLPYNPNITLGYAFASGDDNPDDNKNHAFRQTGLQSNEVRFGGVAEFNAYGEALDPELSNLQVVTLGFGLRPAPNVSLDLVYHNYRLDEMADEIRNAEVTALTNQVDTHLSRDVGDALDIVLGMRNLFGIRRLGMDFRTGWFFPGDAFLRDDGSAVAPMFRKADMGFSLVTKFWW